MARIVAAFYVLALLMEMAPDRAYAKFKEKDRGADPPGHQALVTHMVVETIHTCKRERYLWADAGLDP